MKVAFVGAGRMGWPMVLRLQGAGHDVCVLTRSAEATERARSAGLATASTTAEACAGAELAVVCVFTDEQVRDVCLAPEGIVATLPAGAAIAIHTTGSPTTAEAIAEAGAARQIAVADVPVSGGAPDISAGEVTLYFGGDDATFQRLRPVLASYGSPVLHAGPLGYGQRVKLINNALFGANIGLVAEAVRLGQSLGVAEDVVLTAISNGSGGRPAAAFVARAGSVEAFADSVGEFVSKDVAVVRRVSAQMGADLGALGSVLDSPFVREHVLLIKP
jgi:3-hydroxyisobutyrate dehydrogenase-like beta-hydroxyacid dehydrogenase